MFQVDALTQSQKLSSEEVNMSQKLSSEEVNMAYKNSIADWAW